MRIFGMPIPFTQREQKQYSSLPYIPSYRYSYPIVQEPFPGAWQSNQEIRVDTVASFHADFACKTLIARDIAKLRVKLTEKDDNDIWTEVTNPAFSPVLRRPNDYQTRNQFWEGWVLSKLSRGNAYVLKVRDNRNVVTSLHVLDPTRVQPLVSDDGSVFYRLSSDNIAGIGEVTVPAREIIHDRMNCLFHPLVGTPPVYAGALAAMQGLNIQRQSTNVYGNNSVPGGILTAPGNINDITAQRLKSDWETNFGGVNVGRIAILGDGLKYERMGMTAEEGQLIDQLKWTAEVICSVYHVPPYKIGVGALPSYNNVQALNVEYYAQALQSHIEEIEELLDHGLGIGGWAGGLGTEFDTDTLLRMDSTAQVDMLTKAVQGTILSPNEARAFWSRKPVTGGASPMAQHQMYSLEALAKRDAMENPFAPGAPAQPPTPAAEEDEPPEKDGDVEPDVAEEKLAQIFTLQLRHFHREAMT
jgi:HK97 family phage portal protein